MMLHDYCFNMLILSMLNTYVTKAENVYKDVIFLTFFNLSSEENSQNHSLMDVWKLYIELLLTQKFRIFNLEYGLETTIVW